MTPSLGSTEPEHPIEPRNFSLYLLSTKGELKPREEPRVVNDSDGGTTVFLDFEAVPGEVVLGCAISLSRRRNADSAIGPSALRAPR
jgi:hypothetical protein